MLVFSLRIPTHLWDIICRGNLIDRGGAMYERGAQSSLRLCALSRHSATQAQVHPPQKKEKTLIYTLACITMGPGLFKESVNLSRLQ